MTVGEWLAPPEIRKNRGKQRDFRGGSGMCGEGKGAGGGTLNPAEQARHQAAVNKLGKGTDTLQLEVWPHCPALQHQNRGYAEAYPLFWCRWWDSEPRRASSASSCGGQMGKGNDTLQLEVWFHCPAHRHQNKGYPDGVPLILVPVVGLEPTRCRHQRILSPSRLPIPSHRRMERCF